MAYPLALHVAFGFDAIIGHAQAFAVSDHDLARVRRAAQAVPCKSRPG